MAMPEQRLERDGFASRGLVAGASPIANMAHRRLLLLVSTLVLALVAAHEMAQPLAADGLDLLDFGFLALFFGLFAWITFGFLGALAGFFVTLRGRGTPDWTARGRLPDTLNAVLVPVYNEDIEAVCDRLAAMSASLAAENAANWFDFFLLSDSGAALEAAEVAAYLRLRDVSAARVFYRRRPENVARKPGNVADWLRRFGGAYPHMVVLDADSLMSGGAMIRLAVAMEDRPSVGLIQTVPTIINGRTFFARWHQFAATAYGSIASAGLQWWSGAEATFWGHNAIVRTRAFAESCGLPTLTGPEPFGGHILSHDMVEAALLRRRGWEVHMANLPQGSYEEFPPTLVDHSIRNRRWCQGNLQHVRLLHASGFHWVNRLQLLMGASAYLTSPLWLMLLVVGLIEPVRGHYLDALAVMPSGWLIALTVMLLLGPKLIAFGWLAADRQRRAAFGGLPRLVATMLIEVPLSTLVAPITMLSQTMAIIDIVRGRSAGWTPQRRDANGMTLGEALIVYRWHVAIGALFGLAMLADVDGAYWALPITVSLLLAPLTASITSRHDLGDWLQRHGLFVSPQPIDAAGVTGRVRQLSARHAVATWRRGPLRRGYDSRRARA
jgi:membrane glycosyltransferase